MRLTFLGTGTSFGIPVLGCACAVCSSDDPRDRRTRSGALLDLPDGRLLVDTPPELRLQLLREGVTSLDAVWITHTHADHLHGIDDLRAFSVRRSLAMWVPSIHQAELRTRFPYIFDPTVLAQPSTTKPEIEVRVFRPLEPVRVLGAELTPLPVPHGVTTVFGFRAGSLGYVTDGKTLPPSTLAALEGVRTLVLNALWLGKSTSYSLQHRGSCGCGPSGWGGTYLPRAYDPPRGSPRARGSAPRRGLPGLRWSDR